jgi:hypothetical protein
MLQYLNLPPTSEGVNVPKFDSHNGHPRSSPQAAPAGATAKHDFTAEPLTSAAPQISTPRLGQVHILHAEPLTTKPPELGGEPPPDPGVHRLKAAPSRQPRKRDSPRIRLIQTVLRQGVPEWSERFPTVEEMPNQRLQIKGKTALAKDPRTCGPEWEWNKIRKSFMRAVGREKRK